jgi:radical SAM protein with 4Fe4S-binding SPASM domain
MMLNGKTSRSLLNSGLRELFISLDGHDNESFYKIRGIKNKYDISCSNTIDFLKLKKENPSDMKIILSMIDFPLNSESIMQTRSEWESLDGIDEFLMKTYTTWDGSVNKIHELSPATNSDPSTDNAKITCSFPWGNMTVTWDGDVVPCCFDFNKKYVLGNAGIHPLSYIWNDDPMQNLRREFLNNRISNKLCLNCEKLRS